MEEKTKKIINLKHLLFILFIAFIIRLVPVMFSTDQQADMMLYKQQASPIIRHLNIYKTSPGIFPYSPISMFIPAFCMILSNIFKIPFQIVMKIPALIGDVCIAVSIYPPSRRKPQV